MSRRKAWGLLLGVAASLTLVSCGSETSELRYRLTVDVETPQGLSRGYAIRAVTMTKTPSWNIFARHIVMKAKGEAIAIDLPEGKGTLFALLSGERHGADYSLHVARDAFSSTWYSPKYKDPEGSGWPNYGLLFADLKATKARAILHCPDRFVGDPKNRPDELSGDCPLFVRFEDITDPSSVEQVDPRNMPATFGAGFKIKQVTLEVTDQPLTIAVSKRFAWWQKYRNQRMRLNGSNDALVSSDDIAEIIGTGEFSTGAE